MKKTFLAIFAVFALFIVGCSQSSSTDEQDNNDEKEQEQEVQAGGELKIAVSAQPPTLDGHLSTAIIMMEIGRNIFETLVALDENLVPQPLLAESIDRSDDGLTYTFNLREGVLFHNGEEMKAEDVVASMNRWLENSPLSDTIGNDAFQETDEYTVTVELDEPVSDLLDIMAGLGRGQYTPIMPKEIVESATESGVSEYIGTGPFKFTEWRQDQYIHLEKFEDYQSIDSAASAISGKREALVDDVYYYFVADDSTRLAGIQTGEYDVADNMPFDSYDQLQSMDGVNMYVAPSGTQNIIYNKKEGIMSDVKLRQAVNAALNTEAIMLASFANENLYELEHGYMSTDQTSWASSAGSESYNQNDIEKAKQLAEEAGYNGEEIIIMTTSDYDYMYNTAVVAQEQLKSAGFNAKLDVYDWATSIDRRNDPANWDIFVTSTAFVTSPSQLLALDPNWGGWTSDPQITELMEQIRLSTTQEDADEHWDTLQGYLWDEYLPMTIAGHHHRIVAARDHVKGLEVFPGAIPWNTSVDK